MNYDIVFVAGYSTNGNTIYIDRDLPVAYKDSSGNGHAVDPFLVMHEATEKAMLVMWDMPYKLAHQISLRAEEASIQVAGLDWGEYDGFMEEWIEAIGRKRPSKVPSDLDMTPYEDEKDDAIIAQMRLAMG